MSKFAIVVVGLAIGCVSSVTHGATTFSSTGNNLTIPDNDPNGVSLDIVVNSNFIIADLDIGLIITHSYQGDIIATIEHVGFGGPQTLIDRPGVPETVFGYSADNFGNLASGAQYVLDDIAPNFYDVPAVPMPGITNINGGWRPSGGLLSAFNGQTAAGIWRLHVSDNGLDDIGSIRTFSLIMEPTPAPGGLALLGIAGLAQSRRRRS